MKRQHAAWAGEFGNAYHLRNEPVDQTGLWAKVMRKADKVDSVLEVGAGQGDNLHAFKYLHPGCRVTGIDINETACKTMESRGFVAVHGVFPDVKIDNRYDLVLTRGFLIHVPTGDVDTVLDAMHGLSKRYIAIAEYYSPNRRRVSYRGYNDLLYVDDFAGRLMKRHPDLSLVDYGFEYWVDGGYDLTWFLLEKDSNGI